MALLNSRDGKLNVIITILVLEFFMFTLYIWTNVNPTQPVCQRSTDIKPADLHTVKAASHNMETKAADHQNAITSLNNAETAADRSRATTSLPQENDCGQLPTDQELYTLSHDVLAHHYHDYVNSIQKPCSNIVRHGNVGDGGWDVCMDAPYTVTKPCIVYSFGIKDDWSFDDSITAKYGCQLHAYDPSVNEQDHDRGPYIHFHRTGLGNSNKRNELGWRMRTFSSMLKENGNSDATIDVLKMDIEESEWDALPEMLVSGALEKVRQLCFEVHLKIGQEPEPDKEKYIRGIKLFKDLYHAGFRIFKTHKNMDAKYHSRYGMERTGCHEIYMVKSKTKNFGCK